MPNFTVASISVTAVINDRGGNLYGNDSIREETVRETIEWATGWICFTRSALEI